MKKTSFAIAALALLVFASGALASTLPKPTTNLIDVPTSIGGVKINQSEAKARQAWGKSRGECELTQGSGNCNYGDYGEPTGSATVSFYKNKVIGMSVTTGQTASGKYKNASGVLAALKTSGGLGLGSPAPKVKKAYPKAEQIGDKSDGFYTFVIKGKGKGTFSFSIFSETNKVYMISANNGLGG